MQLNTTEATTLMQFGARKQPDDQVELEPFAGFMALLVNGIMHHPRGQATSCKIAAQFGAVIHPCWCHPRVLERLQRR